MDDGIQRQLKDVELWPDLSLRHFGRLQLSTHSGD
jgi:hypothetical protein